MIIERDNLSFRTVALILVGLGLVIGGVIFYPKLKERFARWKQGGSIEQVKKFTAEKDVPNALLAIKAALSQDPGNPAVWRMAADFAEQLGDADSVSMRDQVVRLEPEVTANRLALARTALHFKDLVTARATLEKIPVRDRLTADYRRVAAGLAMVSDLPAEATALLTLVLKEEPGDLQARLDRATLGLRFGAPTLVAAARGDMEALAERPETRVRALRELTLAALRAREVKAATDYVAQLVAGEKVAFTDRLLGANVELAAERSSLDSLLPELKKQAQAEPAYLREFVAWLSAQNRTAEASRWLATLPVEVQETPAARIARTDCFVALREWEAARALIAGGAYGPISADAVQLAFAARVLRDNDRAALQRANWDEAVRLASYDLAGLRVLHRLALEWRWGAELNVVLLAIAKQHRSQTWAFQALVERHYRARDSAALRTTYQQWREAEPQSAFVEGNALFLELLSAPTAMASPTKERVAQLYASEPKNAFFATAHAFALWQSERAADAVAVMETLPLAERREPSRVLYVALFLHAAGKKPEARRYFDLVPAATLLPEEQSLYRSLARALGVNSLLPLPLPAEPAASPSAEPAKS